MMVSHANDTNQQCTLPLLSKGPPQPLPFKSPQLNCVHHFPHCVVLSPLLLCYVSLSSAYKRDYSVSISFSQRISHKEFTVVKHKMGFSTYDFLYIIEVNCLYV